MITSGMGRYITCLPRESVVSMLEFSAISEALNVIGIGVVKISVCLTLLRVVDRGRRRISQFLWCLLVFVAVTHLALAMLFFLHCRPLAVLWNPKVHGSCLSTQTTVLAGYVGFAIDGITDLICASIPILVIHRLQMNVQTKVALCILMGLGVFTAGCAVAKAVTLKGVFADDDTWGFTKPATWAAVEQFVGVIIASVPALRPLFSGFLANSRSWSPTFPDTRKIFSWSSKPSDSSPMESSNVKEQEGHLSGPGLRGSENSTKKLLAWYKEAESLKRNEQLSQSTTGYQENTVECADLEKLDEEHGINYLSEWSLPNIADRRSTIISLPLPSI